jgi:hypothetical protein
VEELKTHIWFQQFAWGNLKSKTMKAPITPLFEPDPLLQQPLPSPPLPDDQETQLLLRKQDVEGLFADFYYELKKEKTEKEKKTSEKKEGKDEKASEMKKPSRQRP